MPPLAEPIVGMFTSEWDRFKEGVANLHPSAQAEFELRMQQKYSADERNTLYLPGMIDPATRRPGSVPLGFPGGIVPLVGEVHLRPRPSVTDREKSEYYAARTDRRAANLDPSVIAEIDRRREQVRRMETSTDAGMARSWGSIMTSIDNVQDFFSTLATFGRLTMWAAPRIAGRLHPVTGAILTVSDVLNWLGLLGMIATPVYALLCMGPRAAFAAAIPLALFKQGLKNETWKYHSLNPFSRRARIHRAARSLGKLPSLSNLLEVAQTTDQLFGVGISFGATIGFVNQAAQAATMAAAGVPVRVQANPFSEALTRTVNRPFREDHPLDTRTLWRAAGILIGAPTLLARANSLPDTITFQTLVGVHQALALYRQRLKGYHLEDLYAGAWEREWSPPPIDDILIQQEARDRGIDPQSVNLWALDEPRPSITGDELGAWTLRHVVPALNRWLYAHRGDELGVIGGALMSEATEFAFLLATDDPDALRWSLTTEARIISSLAEESLLPVTNTDPARIFAFWQAAKRLLEQTEATSLEREQLIALLDRHRVPYLIGAPPDRPWPLEWQEWARSSEGRQALSGRTSDAL